jgi:hypothetical protein
MLSEGDLAGPSLSTRVWVDDVNADGKLDLLVGDSTRLVSPAAGLSKEEYEEKEAAWQKEMEEATARFAAAADQEDPKADSEHANNWLSKVLGFLREPSPRERAQKRISELYRERRKFVNEEYTGFVWLYLQK